MSGISQLFLGIGLLALMVPITWPNLKSLGIRSRQMFKQDVKSREYDRTKVKPYLEWVVGLTAFYAIYNAVVMRSMTNAEAWQFTGVEFMLSAAGLVAVILEKRDGK